MDSSNMTPNDGKKKEIHFKRLGRELAMQYLFQVDLKNEELRKGEPLLLFWKQAEESDVFPKNRSFRKGREYAEKIIDGVIESQDLIDGKIKEFSARWDMARMAVVDRNIIRVAVYEMLFCPDIPPVVSINEAVEIVKIFGSDNSSNFINGILNGIKDSLDRPSREAVDKL